MAKIVLRLEPQRMVCSGLVMTRYRSIEMAKRFIMEEMPKRAPQKA